ncbi:MAG TPA: pitrilysin family protein [Phycisphaerae bacterium]|nr:pitrilysin family protein [Phycisphaerae bacterium]
MKGSSARSRLCVYLLAAAALPALGLSCAPQQTPVAGPAGVDEAGALTVAERLEAPRGVTAVKLSNGITVLIKPTRTAPVVTVRAYVRAGGLYEGPWLGCGISHLVEHLVAKDALTEDVGGVRAKPAGAPVGRLAQIGGQSNAYTSLAHTCYHISASASKAGDCIDYIAQMMVNRAISPEDFEREHGVVQRELELGKDNPRRVMGAAHARSVFGTHPAAVPVIGYAAPLAALTRRDVVEYHRRMYGPQNMVFVVAGDVDAQAALRRCCTALAGLGAGRLPDLTLPEVKPLAGVSRTVVSHPETKETSEYISFLTIPLVHEDLYALDVLSYVLTEGQSSRLVERIERQGKLVTSVDSSSWTPAWGRGEFTISFRTSPAKADAAEKAILDELRSVIADGVTDEELARAKRQKVADFVYSQQSVESQAAQLASDYITTGDLEFSAHYTERIQSVTAEQVRRMARKYFTLDAMAITRMQPRVSAARTTTAPQAQQEEHTRLLRLPNGLRVVLHPTDSVKLVSMCMAATGGVLLETDKANGLGTMMTTLSTKGAGDRTAEQIAAFFDRAGGGISASCGNNTFLWQATVLDDSLDGALEIFADVVQRPTYPAKELGIYRQMLLKQIERTDEDLLGQAFKLGRAGFFVGSPYRLSPSGKTEVVKSATAAQLAEYHRRHVKAGSSVLAIYGHFDADQIAAKVSKLFAAMPEGAAEMDPAKLPSGPAGDRLEVVKTGKKGAAVVVYQPGMTLDNLQDRMPLDVLDTIISGYHLPSGWLHTELRGKQLVYVVHAYNWAGLAPGAFVTFAACQPEKASEVVAIIRKHLNRAAAYTPTQQEVDLAVNTILTAKLLGSQSMQDLATTAALDELYGFGYDFLKRTEALYRKVTPADVRRVGEKYFGKGYFILVTTPRPELLNQ